MRVESDQAVYFSLSESGFDAEAVDLPLAEGVEIDRVHLADDGGPVTRAALGDELVVRLRVRSRAGDLENLAITDLLPGGFEIVPDSVKAGGLDYVDIREDRLVAYGGVSEQVTEIDYRIRATVPGEFAVPAAHVVAMYDRDVRGRTASGQISVSRR